MFQAENGRCKGTEAQTDISRAARGFRLLEHKVQDGDRVGTLLDVAGKVVRARSSLHSLIQGISVEPKDSKCCARHCGYSSERDAELKVRRREMDKKAADK